MAIDESTYSKSIKPAPAGDEAEVEIMRQFVAKNKKIINRGDSVRLVLFESFNHVHVDTRCFVN